MVELHSQQNVEMRQDQDVEVYGRNVELRQGVNPSVALHSPQEMTCQDQNYAGEVEISPSVALPSEQDQNARVEEMIPSVAVKHVGGVERSPSVALPNKEVGEGLRQDLNCEGGVELSQSMALHSTVWQ